MIISNLTACIYFSFVSSLPASKLLLSLLNEYPRVCLEYA